MHSLVSLMATAGYRSHNSQKTLHTIDSRYIMVIHDNDSAHSTTIMMIKLWSDLHSRMTPFTLPLQVSYVVPSMSYTRKMTAIYQERTVSWPCGWADLAQHSLDKMAASSQTIFSDAFSQMKNFVFWLKFHWSLFLRVQLTITWYWVR